MTHAALPSTSTFPPYTPHPTASNGAVGYADRVAELIRREPSLLDAPDRLAAALELDRRTLGTRLQVVESGVAPLDGQGASVLVLVLGRDDDDVPTEDQIRERFGLTRRESTVAWCLAHRQSNDEIARSLAVSPHTARHHTERVLGKLKVHSRRAVRAVLLSRPSLEDPSGSEEPQLPPPAPEFLGSAG